MHNPTRIILRLPCCAGFPVTLHHHIHRIKGRPENKGPWEVMCTFPDPVNTSCGQTIQMPGCTRDTKTMEVTAAGPQRWQDTGARADTGEMSTSAAFSCYCGRSQGVERFWCWGKL